MLKYNSCFGAQHGEVSEWFKELVLKTSDAKAPRVRISASPPFFYLNIVLNSEKYSRGRRGAPAKGVGRATGARVQIPLSPLVVRSNLKRQIRSDITEKTFLKKLKKGTVL